MLSMLVVTVVLGITPTHATGAQPIVAERPPSASPSNLHTAFLPGSTAQPGAFALRTSGPRATSFGRVLVDPVPEPATLAPGDEGPPVARLQERLRDLGVYRGEADGVFGPQTAASVVALHKVIGVARTNEWTIEDWGLTDPLNHSAILQRNPDEPDRVEIDISRQVMFIVREGEVAAVVPVSTGNGEQYWSQNGGPNGGYVRATTPRGDYTLFRHVPGWRTNYLGSLFKPWYFTPYYAIHGSRSVPSYPASHGCVRVPTWESNHLDAFLEIGLPVHIWET